MVIDKIKKRIEYGNDISNNSNKEQENENTILEYIKIFVKCRS